MPFDLSPSAIRPAGWRTFFLVGALCLLLAALVAALAPPGAGP